MDLLILSITPTNLPKRGRKCRRDQRKRVKKKWGGALREGTRWRWFIRENKE